MKNALIACTVVLLVYSGAAAHEPDCEALDKAIVEIQTLTADVTSQAWIVALLGSGLDILSAKKLSDLSVPIIEDALRRRIKEFEAPYFAISRAAGCGGKPIPEK